jgi:hypothetical protein
MKRIYSQTGGRPLFSNDLMTINSELLDAVESQYKDKGAFIIQGCVVVGNNIGSGIVFIDGKIMRFDGETGVSFPCYIIKGSDTLVDFKNYQDNVSKATYNEIKAIHSTSQGNAEYITITSTGGRTFQDAWGTFFVRTSGAQTVAGNKTFTGNITALNIYSKTETDSQIDGKVAVGVSAEASARNSADNNLQTNIDSEASTRSSADTNLQNQINNLAAKTLEAWKSLPLNPGWTPAVGETAPQYRKDNFGLVHLRGTLNRTPGAGTQICVLPGGYQATRYQYRKVYVGIGATTSNDTVTINANGGVYWNSGTDPNLLTLSLDGVNYFID